LASQPKLIMLQLKFVASTIPSSLKRLAALGVMTSEADFDHFFFLKVG
jgi:hypothetical protein